MKKVLCVAMTLVLASSAMAAYDPGLVQAQGVYATLAEAPTFLGEGNWEYVVDFYSNGGGNQSYSLWGFDNGQIQNKWNTQLRQFWNGRDAYIGGGDTYSPSTGNLELRWDNYGAGWYTVGTDTWVTSAAPFSMVNPWHLPSEYAVGGGATTPSGDPDYSVPAWSWVEDQELQGHYDAGQTYGGYYCAEFVASEDMMYIANDAAVWGHGAGLYFTMRVVTPQELEAGDLTWSLPDSHSEASPQGTAGVYDVLWVGGGDPTRPGDFTDDLGGAPDDMVNAYDIDALADAILNGGDVATFDLVIDGVLDSLDMDMLIEMLADTTIVDAGEEFGFVTGTFYGDFNLDGTVNLLDLNKLTANYNGTGGWTLGDANGDGSIALLDLNKLTANYNSTVVVPEPATMTLLALGAVALIRRKS
jgi:hypothetical protein